MNPHTRRTDPDTSAQAAATLQHLARERQRILDAFTSYGDMTDSELEHLALNQDWPYAGTRYYYRRRRSDLKSAGLIRATDQRRPNARGNNETVWTINRKANTMTTRQPASFDEGTIIFRKLNDGQWAIEGVNLTPGETVAVYTREGQPREVIVGQIVETSHGVDTALFEWADRTDPDLVADGTVIFHRLPDGEWAIRGLDLMEGDEVDVTTKAGNTRTVIVGTILAMEDNLATARFEWADNDTDPDLITFTSNPHAEGYLIRGLDLTPGTTVPVVKKSGKPVRVTVATIIDTDDDGYQLATFTWPTPNAR